MYVFKSYKVNYIKLAISFVRFTTDKSFLRQGDIAVNFLIICDNFYFSKLF